MDKLKRLVGDMIDDAAYWVGYHTSHHKLSSLMYKFAETIDPSRKEEYFMSIVTSNENKEQQD
tara:strand:+ start:3522 stop:3710 length:189 start_codon:yes stop_codon:yes gene_type:complete